MSLVRFITHPEVRIDPAVPVPDWPLSAFGRERMVGAVARGAFGEPAAIFASSERKASEAAEILAAPLGLAVRIVPELGENDRSGTGFLPPQEFERTADLFFAHPETSVRGWERAVDAQRRIVAAIEQVIAAAPEEGDIAVVAHGAVGALLLCQLKGVAISRAEDQPGRGGGNHFSFGRADRALRSGWQPIETV